MHTHLRNTSSSSSWVTSGSGVPFRPCVIWKCCIIKTFVSWGKIVSFLLWCQCSACLRHHNADSMVYPACLDLFRNPVTRLQAIVSWSRSFNSQSTISKLKMIISHYVTQRDSCYQSRRCHAPHMARASPWNILLPKTYSVAVSLSD